ncbi:unnamed protein product [Prorocentrum cordatum]|uniref:Uncharacterized protein n=1 Tax=Prorocentrum cordatum TaxID=2364126 RepID=A0ABN9T206_9DINO|nr:unnamed protein product [Polarella glacialis]
MHLVSPSSQRSKSLSPALRRAYSSKKRFPVLGGSDSFGAQERSADQVRQSIEALPFSEARALQRVPVAILTPLVKSMGRRCKALQRVMGKDFEAGARAALGLRLERERPPLGRAADLRGLGAAGSAWVMLARGLLRAAGGDRRRATFGTKPGQCPAQPWVRLAM